MQGTKYDTEILAALLSPGSKCAQNLLQLARDIARNRDSPLLLEEEVAAELPNFTRSRSDSDEQASTVHQESNLAKEGEQRVNLAKQGYSGGDDQDTSSACDDGCPDIRLKKSTESSMPVLF